jgi:Nif-specific regulatory protein
MKSLDLDDGGDRPARWTDVALSGMYEISKVLTCPERIETTLSNVIALLASYLGMQRALIALLGEEGEPQVVVGSGWNEETALSHFERLPERAVGQIVVSQAPLVVRDMAADPLFADWQAWESDTPEERCTFIGVPIKDRDQVIGTISIERNYLDDSSVSIDEDVRFLTMIAGLVGQTVRLQILISRDRERLMQANRIEKARDSGSSKRDDDVGEIIGQSRAVRSILEKIAIVARTM